MRLLEISSGKNVFMRWEQGVRVPLEANSIGIWYNYANTIKRGRLLRMKLHKIGVFHWGQVMSRFASLACMAVATFAAAGVRADAITWEGTTNIAMTANIEVEVSSGTTNYIGTLSGAYTLTKVGGGTLQIRRVSTTTTKISVQEGDVVLRNPRPEAFDQAYFHVDASDLSSMVIETVNGTNFVTRWNDCDGRTARYATHCTTEWECRTNPENRKPFLGKNSLNGLPVVDFGSLLTKFNTNEVGQALGYGAAMNFDQISPSIAIGFTVAADGDDIPKWPSIVSSYASMVPQSLFANEGTLTFPRGNYDTTKSSSYTARCILQDAGKSLSVYPNNSDSIWRNGSVLTSYAKWNTLSAGFNVIRVKPDPYVAASYQNHVRFGSFAASRNNADGTLRSYGGQRIAEYALFTNSLDNAVAEDIDLYLRLKWYTKQTIAAVTVADGASFRIGENVIVSVNMDTLRNAGTVLHLDASQTNTMEFTTINGTNFVTRWNDCAGGSLYATHNATSSTLRDDPDNRKPFFGPVTLNGLPVMDFGSAILKPVTNSAGRGLGYGASMNLSAAQDKITEAISVVSDTEDLKTLQSGNGKKDGMFGPAFFAGYGTATTAGARGKTVNGKNPTYFASYKQTQTMYLDGVAVSTSGRDTTSYPDGFHVLDFIYGSNPDKYCRVDYLARNNQSTYGADTYGGQRIAEYMLFKTKTLTDEQRNLVLKALRAKWFGDARETRTYGSLAVPHGSSFSIVHENVSVTGETVLGGSFAAPLLSAGDVKIVDDAKMDGAVALADGAALSFGRTSTGVASLKAGSVTAASGSGTISVVTAGLPRKAVNGTSMRLVESESVDPQLASYSLSCDVPGASLRVAADGLYVDFPVNGLIMIFR